MINLIKKSNFKEMLWKNGRGNTSEILILPKNASLERFDFHLRLSSAKITESGDFSSFPGFKRLLIPIEGKGFSLNGYEYENFEVAEFDGADQTHCQLNKGAVLDYGIIFDSRKITVTHRILKLTNSFNLGIESQLNYLICTLRGEVKINDQILCQQEAAYVENESQLNLYVTQSSVILFLKIYFVKV